jgi:hypothetical protein
MTQLEKAIAKSQEVFDLVKGQFGKWDNQVKGQIKKLEDWRNAQTISFSANQFYWGGTPNVTFPSVLKAENVESNRGSGYDPKTGIFTAPSDGSYLFAATVFVSTVTGLNKDGSKPDFAKQKKWHDDMHFNINRYDANKQIKGDGTGADKIGEIWIGEDGGLITDDTRKKWFRKSASATAIRYLKKGEKVAIEFQIWDEAEAGDQVMVSFNFSGTKLH